MLGQIFFFGLLPRRIDGLDWQHCLNVSTYKFFIKVNPNLILFKHGCFKAEKLAKIVIYSEEACQTITS